VERLKPLLQIFYQQCISSRITVSRPRAAEYEGNGLLMLLDEFASLGRMKFLENTILSFRRYKLKICLVLNNIDELENVYGCGGASSILSSCNIKTACYTNNYNTSVFIGELVGSKIVSDDSGNRSAVPLLLLGNWLDCQWRNQ
jgi:type IV secretion system protein VirD4